MSFQGVMNTRLGDKVGVLETNVFVQGTGLVLALVIMLIFGKGNLALLPQAPWYAWLGGVTWHQGRHRDRHAWHGHAQPATGRFHHPDCAAGRRGAHRQPGLAGRYTCALHLAQSGWPGADVCRRGIDEVKKRVRFILLRAVDCLFRHDAPSCISFSSFRVQRKVFLSYGFAAQRITRPFSRKDTTCIRKNFPCITGNRR